jgi:hypothetical protein
VVDNSACETNFHVHTDLDDFHVYRGMPERRASWDEWVDEFVGPPGLELHPVRRRERTGEEPLVVSEFGNWGLPDIAEMAGPDGVDPWWAAPGRDWAFGAAEATDTVGRFYKHRLDQVFGSWQGFVEATQRQQLLGTRYQIGSLRRRPQIAGYVLTQLSDVQWEANGLFDMDRRPADVRRRAVAHQRPGDGRRAARDLPRGGRDLADRVARRGRAGRPRRPR